MNTKTHVTLPSADIYRRVSSSIWTPQFALGVLCLLGVFALLWSSFSQMNMAYSSFGPAAVPGWGQAELAQAGLLFLVVLLILILLMAARKYGLVVSKEGLTFYRPFFAEVFISWVSIEGIAFAQDQFTLKSNQRDNRAAIWLKDAQHVSLNKYIHPRDIPTVVTRIKAELYPQLEIRLRNMLLAGQEVPFGPVALNANGLKYRSKPYSWDQIDQVTLEKGLFKLVLSDQKSLRLNIFQIPNLEILVLLFREFEKK